MYSIRLELGRQEEDLAFEQYKLRLYREEIKEAKYQKKKSVLLKRFLIYGLIFVFLILNIILITLDIIKGHELNQLIEEIENRPVYFEAHPMIDASYREEVERQLAEEEARKAQEYSAVEAPNMKSIGEDVVSEYAIVVDANTNEIMAGRNYNVRISPASMTKILTVLVAVENIEESQLDDTFTITPDINYYAYRHDCSSVGFADDETVTVRDLLYGTILPSGADAAMGLAEYVAGSQEAFVDLMNEKLKTLGISETAHFTNCIGLYDLDHYCTVYDMAMIIHAAIDNDLVREIMSKHIYTTSPTEQHPDGIEVSNWFLRRIEDKPVGGTVLCAKTGYVKESGNCAASFGTDEQGSDYIVVTGMSTSSWRCIYDHVALYREFFPNYDSSKVDASKEAEELAEGDNH